MCLVRARVWFGDLVRSDGCEASYMFARVSVCMYLCFLRVLCVLLCVTFVYVCGQSVGNQTKEVVCICVTKSQAERFMRVRFIELGLSLGYITFCVSLCVCFVSNPNPEPTPNPS